MRKYNAENERLKRRYEQYLREAKGQDDKSIDKMRAALVQFEDCTKYKPFRGDQARQFKDVSRAKTARGKPPALTTIDATLRLVKGFLHRLAGQQSFNKVVTYSEVEYFNNNSNDAWAAHAQRTVQYSSIKATHNAFQ